MSKKNESVAVEETPTAITIPTGPSHFDVEDIDIPRLNIVQKMSSIEGPTGSIVLNKEHVLAEPENPLNVVIVSAQKGWREDIPFDEDKMPRMAWTKEAAQNIELDSEYGMIEFAEITLLIAQPEGATNDEAFPFTLGGINYALGRMNVSKNAYRSTYKRLATFATFNRNVPLNGRVWSLNSEVMSKGKYTWHNPSLSLTKVEVDPEVSEFLQSFGA
jgi:hypothetical protein